MVGSAPPTRGAFLLPYLKQQHIMLEKVTTNGSTVGNKRQAILIINFLLQHNPTRYIKSLPTDAFRYPSNLGNPARQDWENKNFA